jgi:hypothetical protein
MASSKYYAYYIRGRQLAIVQHDYTLGSGQTLSQPGLNSVGARGDVLWKSPTEAVEDGLEIEYAYSPRYFIDETDDKNTAIDTYVSLDGLLKIIDQGDDDYSASPESLSDGSYIVLKKAGRFNGLHKVKDVSVAGSIVLYTKYSGSSTVQKSFEETPELYYNVDALNDESDTIDLPEYLTKALVYYVKAKIAEDRGELEQKEYNMREFKRLLERNESAKVWGARRIGTDETAIR